MDISIFVKNFSLKLYRVSGVATNNNWADTGLKLMNEMWKQVKSNNLKNDGINVWVYENDNKMFAGVKLEDTPANDIGLEQKNINLVKYAYYKHVGPYGQIRQAGWKVLDELRRMGNKTREPYIEIYGHWTADETKLETEMIWCLEG